MKIGYYVQGDADEAFIWGLVRRWCPDADLAPGRFRGSSQESFRREIRQNLMALKDNKRCEILVVLTDSDANAWREVSRREWEKIPEECQYMTIFGVADRNIECWLAIDQRQLAEELNCSPSDIPDADPSGFVKRHFGLSMRDSDREYAKNRLRNFVAAASLKYWIENSDSFEDFYRQIRQKSAQNNCDIPNELESA